MNSNPAPNMDDIQPIDKFRGLVDDDRHEPGNFDLVDEEMQRSQH